MTIANALRPPNWSRADIISMKATLVSKEQFCGSLKEKARVLRSWGIARFPVVPIRGLA